MNEPQGRARPALGFAACVQLALAGICAPSGTASAAGESAYNVVEPANAAAEPANAAVNPARPAVEASRVVAPVETVALIETYRASKEALAISEERKRRILGSLYAIYKRMRKMGREKGKLTDELIHVESNVRTIAKVIAEFERRIANQRSRLRTRLRAFYKLSGEGYLAMIFSTGEASDLDRVTRSLKTLTDSDHQLIRAYQRNVEVYETERRKFRTQLIRLKALQAAIRDRETKLAGEHEAKTRIISNLEASRTEALKKIKRIRDRTATLKGRMETPLLGASFFEQRGKLPHPVSGTVTREFGLVRDETHGVYLSHKGRRYAARAGEPIQAVFDGRVAYVGPVSGYGNVLILDHSDHYYTVYAQVVGGLAQVGEKVKAGQRIAEVGTKGTGVYFEVRHFSEPEDPRGWLGPMRLAAGATRTKGSGGPTAGLAIAPDFGSE